ncbi:Hsp70 family protein [bacterium]|nr:Hsp70 family protein [bacterium]MBU1026059.1 Hsp70 family protein [bacterium]
MIVGIDLGTSTSLVAAIKDGVPTLVLNERGKTITPSVVGFSETGELLVGESAKNQAVAHPDRTIGSIKRIMGSDKRVTLMGKEYTPQEISAMILNKLKNDAEAYFGKVADEAVITVPAYFTDAQRQATKDAGEIAGFKVERIINEPTAAALAYGFQHKEEISNLLVYDYGGGTFDVSIIQLVEGAFKVLATSGNNMLGGDDFDEIVSQFLFDKFKAAEGIDLKEIKDDQMKLSIHQRIREAAERAKIDLSTLLETNVNIPFLYSVGGDPKHLDVNITRAELEKMTKSLVEATRQPVIDALAASRVAESDLDAVILVGGTTRIPAVKKFITGLLKKEPLSDIHPEECVAVGAAVQAGVKAGELDDLVVVDVAPYTLGIEVVGDRFSPIIYANTTIPCSQKRRYVTTQDYQQEATINVLQGNHKKASRNTDLGEFVLAGLSQKAKGETVVEVVFDYDVNGIVNVTAIDRETGARNNIVIKQSRERLSDAQKAAAKEHLSSVVGTESDIERIETIEDRSPAQIEAEFYINDATNFLMDRGNDIDAVLREQIEQTISILQESISKKDDAQIDSMSDKLLMLLSDADVQG